MPDIGVVILAAGASVRLGEPKQLLRIGERSLLRHGVETALASALRPVVVVLGANVDRLRPEIEGLDAHIVENVAWEEGMGGSLRVGLAALQALRPDLDAALFMLCDQPLVTADLLNRLADAFRASGKPIIASEYAGSLGVPALFSRRMFPELARLESKEGAKRALRRHFAEAEAVPFPEGVIDIDTAEDYQRFLRRPL